MFWINTIVNKYHRENKVSFWVALLFLIISILISLYTFYRSEIVYEGLLHNKYLIYYVISLGGVIFWLLMLFIKDQYRANITTVFISITIVIYFLEFGMIFFTPNVKDSQVVDRALIAAELGIDFDNRSKLQVIDDLQAQGIEAFPVVFPARTATINTKDFLPLAGISAATTVYNNETGKYLIYKSDRFGFNNPDYEWDSKSTQWLLLGDSFTHGSAVQPGEDVAGQIRILTGDSVINLGFGGSGPLSELATLSEYSNLLLPKKVFLLYYEDNDFNDLSREQNIPILREYLKNNFSQDLTNRQKEIDAYLKNYVKNEKAKVDLIETEEVSTEFQIGAKIKKWIRLGSIRNLMGFNNKINPIFSTFLYKINSIVHNQGGEFYFVYLPGYTRYTGNVNHEKYRNKSSVIKLVQNLNIPVIDIHKEVFIKHPSPMALFPLSIKGHYNAEGYNKVANAIVKFIQRN